MKKFIISLGVFALLMAACDFVVGIVGDGLINNVKGGDTGRMSYLANRSDDDLLIFGSSRANHHYDPNILEDTLGLSSYNGGFDGNGIICEYGFFEMIMERHYPQVLIYDVSSGFDLKINDNHKYLGHLRFFYDKADVKSIFWSVDRTERYKMISKMYRYNSALPQLVMNNLHPFKSYSKGYRPLDKEINGEIKPAEKQKPTVCDSLKLYYLDRLIDDCRGRTLLIFAASPIYENTEDSALDPIKSMCEEYYIPFLNHYTDTTFNFRQDYFSDRTHMNRRGATEYSKVIAHEVKEIIEGQ